MKSASSDSVFRCRHCGAWVSCDALQSGVRNRNHCPACLFSRHVDWQTPGDRLSSCKGLMRPIGLTLKAVRKRYGEGRGELMVVHCCEDCRRLSINRIAADDSPSALVDVFVSSESLAAAVLSDAGEEGIQILNSSDWDTVSRRLFGSILPPAQRKEVEIQSIF
jgi:hypothetical protein